MALLLTHLVWLGHVTLDQLLWQSHCWPASESIDKGTRPHFQQAMDRIDRAAECEDEESRVVASQYQDVPSDVVDSDDEAEALFG